MTHAKLRLVCKLFSLVLEFDQATRQFVVNLFTYFFPHLFDFLFGIFHNDSDVDGLVVDEVELRLL